MKFWKEQLLNSFTTDLIVYPSDVRVFPINVEEEKSRISNFFFIF